MCFVNCHLAAHLEAVHRQNANFNHIFRNLSFARSSNPTATGMMRFLFLCCSLAFLMYLFGLLYISGLPLFLSLTAGVSTSATTLMGANAVIANSEEIMLDLAHADVVVFLGDFNYRLFVITYDEVRDFVSQRSFDWLREKDQLRAEMKAEKVFQGMRKALIRFPPTYKFEKHQPSLAGYDSGEKKRIPAWCDRVIYRDNHVVPSTDCSLECPVVSSIILYEAVMDVNESDHKPVRCKFHFKVAHVDRSIRRKVFGEIIRSQKVQSFLQELNNVPETIVSTDKISLQNQDTSIMRLTNKCVKEKAILHITCEGESIVKDDAAEANYHPRGSYGFPRWLEVTPAAGMVEPDKFVDITMQHEEFHALEDQPVNRVPHNLLPEDTREKEVIVVVVLQGINSTKTARHRIHVRHSFSSKAICSDTKSSNSQLPEVEQTSDDDAT